MRSRTSSSNGAVLKKALTRFAPVWVEYSVMLFIIFMSAVKSDSYNADGDLVVFSFINLFYGFFCAMSVFGYLHDSVECNMVHTFPIRRESYFLIHLAAGFLMGLVPNLVFCLGLIPLGMDEILFLFLGMMLQFIFFYGMSIFCMLLTGRKFAALTLYALLNFLAVLTQWAVTTLYIPQLPGVYINEEPFYWFYPMYQFLDAHGTMEQQLSLYGAFALAGLIMSALAFLLYRRRKLEYAGDFLALKPLTAVFLAALSFASGCVVASIAEAIFDGQLELFLVVGLLTGYFTGLMLLHKTIRVFQPKRLAGAAAIVAVVLGSVWTVGLDLPGRVYFVPELENVKQVSVSYQPLDDWADRYETDDPAVIQDILALHGEILDQPDFSRGYYGYGSCFLSYELTDGTKIQRWYSVRDTETYEHLQYYYSQPQFLLGVESIEEFRERLTSCTLNVYTSSGDTHQIITGEELEKLMELFYSECLEGKMSPANNKNSLPTIDLNWSLDGKEYYASVNVPETAEKTYEYCMELWELYQ